MKRSSFFALTGLIFTGVLSAAANLPEQNYWVRVLDTQGTCEDQALALAQAFHQATKLEVTEQHCRGSVSVTEGERTFVYRSLLLKYRANFAVAPFVAQYSYAYQSREPKGQYGFYASLGACADEISQRSLEFTAQTGLATVAVTCEMSQSSSGGLPYVMKVAGFGDAKKRLYQVTLPALLSVERTRPIYKNILALKKIQVVGESEDSILFYAERYLDIQKSYAQFMETAEQCEVQKAGLKDLFLKAGAVAPVVECQKNEFPTGVFYSLWGIGESEKYLSEIEASAEGIYLSFDECMADRDRVIESRRVFRGDLMLGICLSNDVSHRRGYKIQLSVFR